MLKNPGILAILALATGTLLSSTASADSDGRKYKMLTAPVILDAPAGTPPAAGMSSLHSLNSLGSLNDLMALGGGVQAPVHPGGVNVALADGSVRFLKNTAGNGDAARPGIAAGGANTQAQPVTGRITGVAVDPNNPSRPFNGVVNRFSQGDIDRRDTSGNSIYVGSANGGVWKTENGGKTSTVAPTLAATRK